VKRQPEETRQKKLKMDAGRCRSKRRKGGGGCLKTGRFYRGEGVKGRRAIIKEEKKNTPAGKKNENKSSDKNQEEKGRKEKQNFQGT